MSIAVENGRKTIQSEVCVQTFDVIPTDRPEAFVQVPGVQQRPCLPGLVQGGPHDLVPQGGVQADDLWDVAEQLGGLHLGEQAALLQVQQPALEQLQRGEGEKKKGLVRR